MRNLYEQLGEQANFYFKKIISNNGSEFSEIYEMLIHITDIFFIHPYTPYESGTKENQHKLIRRLIPKSKRLAEVSTQTIKRIQYWINNIPRKILDYYTAKEALVRKLQLLTNQSKLGA